MAKVDYPMTRGVRHLQDKKVTFTPHLYPFEEHGGTGHAAACLHVDEHAIVKTLVMEKDDGKPLLVLMHGDREVSTKNLARALGVKSVAPCEVDKAERVTGYQVGGISPFGVRQPLPVYVQQTILDLPRLYINGGKRGFLVEITPEALQKALFVHPVDVAIIP
ncbi:MAG TPA: aminoacyl-tRNA deacylase [Anaerolineae bacterium]|nr:aminoacyl-tRNA deacylase [Anaerolineae bacterium]HQI84273.1 aminoacyl-tRNA deacylase [Anaerolineae bacterium]